MMRSYSPVRAVLAVMLSWLWAGEALSAPQQQPQPLPEPLTLEHALSLADEPHPALVEAQAELERAEAARQRVAADNGIQAALESRLQWVEPSSVSPKRDHDDHLIGVSVRKRLYDFGRTEARLSAADAEVKGQELLYADARTQRRLDIMGAYFDVLLADLRYARDNEAMAVAYVELDRLRDRREQGQVSDIEVLEAETAYQEMRRRRYASDVRRRSTRAQLALLLNRPGMLSANLVDPQLARLDRELPAVEELQQLALAQNPQLQALREQVEAARQRVQAARAGKYPVIDGALEAAEYTRELGSSDALRGGVTLRVPLYTGGAIDSEIARRRAELKGLAARLAAREMQVRQAALELWQEVYVLRAQQDQARVTLDYRDLYLDRSRALYELDVRTDLGDSMVQFSAARLLQAETRYRLALTLGRLEALLGRVVAPAGAAAQ